MNKVTKLTPEECAQLKAALERITIHDVWRLLKLDGHRHVPPDGSDHACCSPLREDHSPSFSIFDGGRRWKDHGTGSHGDAADFIERALSVSREVATRLIIGLAHTNGNGASAPDSSPPHDPFVDEDKTEKRSTWPKFEVPTEAEIETIARLRGLSPEGIALAVQRGLLFCADSYEGKAWIITDSRRWNAQARRLDGNPWECVSGKKARTLPGSIASWPIGIEETCNFPAIALVEGGPDLLAAFHGIQITGGEDVFAPVAILGAKLDIDSRALPFFVGKTVKIFIHEDESGKSGALRWARQLNKAGVKRIDRFSLTDLKMPDGSPVKDLNDFVRMWPEDPTPEQIEEASAFYADAFTAPEQR